MRVPLDIKFEVQHRASSGMALLRSAIAEPLPRPAVEASDILLSRPSHANPWMSALFVAAAPSKRVKPAARVD